MIDEKEISGIPEVQKPISGLGKIFKDTMKEKVERKVYLNLYIK